MLGCIPLTDNVIRLRLPILFLSLVYYAPGTIAVSPHTQPQPIFIPLSHYYSVVDELFNVVNHTVKHPLDVDFDHSPQRKTI
jgi:hypothetical protein